MQNKLTTILKQAKYWPARDLKQKVWNTIVKRNKRITQIKLWVFSLTGIASLIGIIPAFKIMLTDLTQSGFYEYLSLAFSNSNVIPAYSKELLLSISESLPTMSIILSLSLIFILFLSLKNIAKQIINNSRLSLKFN
jgi:hypothetical protein